MLRAFAADGNGRLHPVAPSPDLAGPVWIDLMAPTPEEVAGVEALIGFALPRPDDMVEIEHSARLYREGDAAVMTANLPSMGDGDEPQVAPVTFILAGPRLVTLRHHEPRAFTTFPARAERTAFGCTSGEAVLVALLESIVERLADILETSGLAIDRLGRTVFRRTEKPLSRAGLQALLGEIGREATRTTHVRESLMALEPLIAYLGEVTDGRESPRDVRARVRTLATDAEALGSHTSFLADKTAFLLEALLGLINIEQNTIIKFFSVVAVVFLPPTLIASIYGMNFRSLPELEWSFGYPLALGLMLLSAILPYLYFKHRGWL
jgi:magnesium transporter